MPAPIATIATIASPTASLTLVVFDASAATEWIPTKPAANKAQFTGHPAQVMRGLAKGEEVTTVDVGPSSGLAFELEGKSGRIEAYRTAAAPLVLVAPPRTWWVEHHADHEIDALFAEALAARPIGAGDDATEVGEIELTSGKLLAAYMWLKNMGAARELAASMPSGGVVSFGDGYGDGDGALIVDLGAGRYRLARHETPAPWDDDQVLVTMFLTPA